MDQQNRTGRTSLCLAAQHGDYDLTQLLLENGALANHRSHDDTTPLWLASGSPAALATAPRFQDNGQASKDLLVRLLIKKGAVVNTPSLHGETPLIAAAAAGRVSTMQTLLDGGADIHARDRHGMNALMHAAHLGQIDAAELLLNLGARTNGARGFLSPLNLAARGGHDAMVALLMQRHADLDYAELDGETALIAAIRRGRTSTVALLLKLGASL